MLVAVRATSSNASPQEEGVANVAVEGHGSPTWTGAIHGTVPVAETVGAAVFLLQTPPYGVVVHAVDVSIIGTHLRRALSRGISHFIN